MADTLGRPNNHPRSRKGKPNKFTRELKDMVLTALKRAGGRGGAEAYLLRLARNDPKTFVPLVAKLIPTRIGSDPDNPIGAGVVHFDVHFVSPQPKKAKK